MCSGEGKSSHGLSFTVDCSGGYLGEQGWLGGTSETLDGLLLALHPRIDPGSAYGIVGCRRLSVDWPHAR